MTLDGEQIINRLWELTETVESPTAKADIRNGLDLIESLADRVDEVGRHNDAASDRIRQLEADNAAVRACVWELLDAIRDRHIRPVAFGTAVGKLRDELGKR